jgi:N-carbamoylputrescine amidase
MSCTEAKQPNVEKAVQRIADAAAKGANIVCLQELFTGPYFCQSEDHRWFGEAESIPGPTSEWLAAAAKKHGVVVIGSLFERRAPGLYHNTAVLFDADGSQAGVYRKMHIPDDPLYYEKFYFTPGDLGFQSFSTKFGKIGICVCWDQWYPEAARLTALSGAEIIFYPTAIGWLPAEKDEFGASQHNAWEMMMRSHAIANGVFVAAPNRVGREGSLHLARCDLGLIDVVRTHWPFFRDRRIDAYGDLTKRYLS